MTQHYPRIRLSESRPDGDRLWMREVVRLVLHLPFDHHDLADRVSRAFDVYLRAVGTGPDLFSEYDLGYEPYELDEDAWARIRAALSPPLGERFLDDLEVPELRAFEQSFYRFLDTSHAALLAKIREKKALDDEITGQLAAVLKEAKEKFKAEKGRAA